MKTRVSIIKFLKPPLRFSMKRSLLITSLWTQPISRRGMYFTLAYYMLGHRPRVWSIEAYRIFMFGSDFRKREFLNDSND